MPIFGGTRGPTKSNSIFNSKKGLENKKDKNKFGTSSSNGKDKNFGGTKALYHNGPERDKYCVSPGTASIINNEDVVL